MRPVDTRSSSGAGCAMPSGACRQATSIWKYSGSTRRDCRRYWPHSAESKRSARASPSIRSSPWATPARPMARVPPWTWRCPAASPSPGAGTRPSRCRGTRTSPSARLPGGAISPLTPSPGIPSRTSTWTRSRAAATSSAASCAWSTRPPSATTACGCCAPCSSPPGSTSRSTRRRRRCAGRFRSTTCRPSGCGESARSSC